MIGLALLKAFWKPAAAIALASLVVYGIHHHGYSSGLAVGRAELSAHLDDDKDATLAAERRARETEQQWQTDLERAGKNAQQSNASQAADLSAADSATGLRDQLAAASEQLKREAAQRAAVTKRGQAATKAAGVLSDLYEGCSRERRTLSVALQGLEQFRLERRDLADYADRARIAGQTCEASFDALTPRL